MNSLDALEILESIVLDNKLPDTEFVLFGVRCPYCGKNDRIRVLDPPEDIGDALGTDTVRYEGAWQTLLPDGGHAGVCWFCRHVLFLREDMQAAHSFTEIGETE